MECGGEAVDVGIDAEHQVLRAHGALRGSCHSRGAILIAEDSRFLEDADTLLRSRGRESERVIERVDVSAVRIVKAAEVTLAREHPCKLLALDQARGAV